MIDLTCKTTIKETVNIIQNSNIVIGGDTGLIHLADAMAVKNIALFGPTDPDRHKPLSSFFSYYI